MSSSLSNESKSNSRILHGLIEIDEFDVN